MSEHEQILAAGESSTTDDHVVSEAEIRRLALNAAQLMPKSGVQVDSSNLSFLLPRIIRTANISSISLAHRGAICNLLSTIISQADSHSSEHFRSLIWKETTWTACFRFVLARFSDSKPKPMKQLLGTLIAVLKKRLDDPAAQASRTWLISELSTVLGLPAGSAPSKVYLYTLTTALNKGVVRLQDIVPTSTSRLAFRYSLQDEILSWAAHDELGPSLASLLTAILQEENAYPAESWYQPLISQYTCNLIVQSCYRHYILPAIFNKDLRALSSFLAILDLESCFGGKHANDTKAELAVSTILVANSSGFVYVDPVGSSGKPIAENERIVLPLQWLEFLSTLQSKVARTASFAFLIGETSTIEPFHPNVLNLFLRKLPIMFADTDADFRSDLLSLVQRIIDRIRAASNALSKRQDRRLDYLTTFLRRWIRVIQNELRPSASYQRHSCALQCIKMLIQSGIDMSIDVRFLSKAAKNQKQIGFQMSLFDPSIKPVLRALLLNPFDDIRNLAMVNLQALTLATTSDESALQAFADFLGVAEDQSAKSGRADHADGVARAYALLYEYAPLDDFNVSGSWWKSKPSILNRLLETYERGLAAAQINMGDAVQGHPIHSTIISLRYILESSASSSSPDDNKRPISNASTRVMLAVKSTWSTVRHVLCNDAPEGYVPEELDEEEADMDSKSILSFCWRALKEASLLQRAFITDKSTALPDQPHLTDLSSTFQQHLDLCFTQLIELRHRGAFSTVAQTFSACCIRFVKLFPEDKQAILSHYERVIASIRNTSTINTRRSAGLPAALAGILSSSESSELFNIAIRDLTAIARESASFPIRDHQALPQVHALNCLRELFKHSKLGQRSEEFIPQSLLLAGQCLTSDLWGVRNSGLMLFRSLIDRLLGTNDSYEDDITRSRAKDLLIKFPELLDLVMSLLSVAPTLSIESFPSVEKVFPALQILQRVSPPAENRDTVCAAVAALTSSPHWHVRDKAARAYARLHQESDFANEWQQCLSCETSSENSRHGQMLCLRYLLRQQRSLEPEIALAVSRSIARLLDDCIARSSSEVVLAVAIDLWRDLKDIARAQSNEPTSNIAHGNPLWVYESLSSRLSADASEPIHPESLFIRSLATAMLYEEASIESWPAIISSLRDLEPDSCASLFDQAAILCGKTSTNPAVVRAVVLGATDFLHNKSASSRTGAIHATVKLLIVALTNYRDQLVSDQRIILPNVDHVLDLNETPLLHDSTLILSSLLLAVQLDGSYVSQNPQTLQRWLLLLRDAAQEDKPFDTRFACVTALSKLQDGLSALKADSNISHMLIDIVMLAYDLTNDDDDEVRDLAALTSTQLLSSKSTLPATTVPHEAGSTLLTRLLAHYDSDPYLLTTALKRLSNLSAPDLSPFTPVRSLLLASTSQDTALFAREKQNLFIDPAREARVWSQVAQRMDKGAMVPEVLDKLQNWVIDGMRALLERTEKNGPLGWASFSGDVFALESAVLFAVEVLLAFKRKWTVTAVKGRELRTLLMKMVQGIKDAGGCPLLVTEGERILIEDLEEGVVKAGRVLGRLGLSSDF
ncbi:hypothetical protein K461DRAFT_258930 [Myriangium duriaei CBS 260.36]|uniref:DUF2428 domain-containing protein n=1 Tax=Myriangium duriaei CBS 260.36 TaxID=1168546 RepID=A0A9P4IVQ4_9PEZI|nr:hypothetical protein K461DRAFT_258930 [Myriangium duriaei CBS 260.36]